ncbi:MAG TPA: methyl-accepting chemotaxis protein [Bacillota bacterium]|nr:methyl-accepting chemotaxis protein [Bacillota bacterium]
MKRPSILPILKKISSVVSHIKRYKMKKNRMENGSNERNEMKKSFNLRIMHRFNLLTILIFPIVFIIVASSSIIAYVSFEKNKQLTVSSIEQQMQSSAGMISEKVSILKTTVTNEEFKSKLSYALLLNQNNFKKSGLTPMQFKITKDKKLEKFDGFESELPNIPVNVIDDMIQQKQGVKHLDGLTFSYAYQIELDETLYVIALKDQEYLKPVTVYRNLMIEMTFVTILLACLVGIYTIRMVTRPIDLLKKGMEKVSNGNLQAKVWIKNSSKEIEAVAMGFNEMVDSLNTLISHLELSSKLVTQSSEKLRLTSNESKHASDEISVAMGQVASGTQRQVDQAAETSSIVEEISKGMQQAAVSIDHVEASTMTANSKATIGNQLVIQTVEQMNHVQETVGETARMVYSLGEKSKRVDQIVSIISQIANQTNLLSLNAAIEAARAGEHGRGFAVVANEVRGLADQSGKSAKQIQSLIEEIRSETQKAVDSMTRGSNVLEKGISMVHQTEEAFMEIAQAVEKVSTETAGVSAIVNEVSAQTQNMVTSMEEVASISKQFAGSMQHVAAATEEQSNSMDEISGAAEDLNDLAKGLEEVLMKFKV